MLKNFMNALRRNQDADLALNEALVALTTGNFELAVQSAQRVLNSRGISKKSALKAKLVLLQVKARKGEFVGLLDELEGLFEKISRSNPELQSSVGNEIIGVCAKSGNLGIGAQRGEQMLREFAASWSRAAVVELLCQLSTCHFYRGDSARAVEVVNQALSLAEEAESPKARTQIFWQSSMLNFNRGDLTLALEQANEAKHWAQVAGLRHILPILNSNAALIMLDLPNADYTQIHQLAEAAYLDLSSRNNPRGGAYVCQILSEIALRTEDYKSALTYAQKGLSELPSEMPGPKTSLLVQVAKVLARMGNYEEAKVELVRATDHMEGEEQSRELAKQWGDIARVFVEVGLTDRGVYAYEKAIQMSGLLREEQDSFIG